MSAVSWIRFITGAVFLLCGLGMFLFEIIGLYHFKYVLNRMHAAAMGDTLGIGFSLIGLIIINGLNMVSLKLFLVVAFLWISSPTSSHLIARLEVSTDTEPAKHYREMDLTDLEEEMEKLPEDSVSVPEDLKELLGEDTQYEDAEYVDADCEVTEEGGREK